MTKFANRSVTDLYKSLKPLILRDLGRSAVGVSVSPGGSSGSSHSHDQYITEVAADLKYLLISTFNAHAGNADAHHARQHAITSGDDHTITASAGKILGTIAENTLGVFDSGADGRAGGIILKTDVAGAIQVNGLQATAIDASTDVSTPELNSAADLSIIAANNLDLSPLQDLELTPGGNIYFDSLIASIQTTEGDPNVYINPVTGLIDVLSIQANEAYFDAVIAEARWAEAGAIELTKSVAPLKRAFTIPDVNDTGTMYVGYLGGLPGYNPLGDGHIVKVPFFQDGGTNQQPVGWVAKSSTEGEGIATGGSAHVYYDVNFSEFDPTGLGTNLMHTGANNSLTEVTNTASVYDDSGNDVLRIETDLTNCHTHYDGSNADTLEDYEYTGRFKILDAGVGLGFTVYSDYPNSDSYYRIRRYNSNASVQVFHVENHGSG